jgi:hypothetical protein
MAVVALSKVKLTGGEVQGMKLLFIIIRKYKN